MDVGLRSIVAEHQDRLTTVNHVQGSSIVAHLKHRTLILLSWHRVCVFTTEPHVYFTAPPVSPATKKRWMARKRTRTGIVATVAPAIRSLHAVLCCPMKRLSPTGNVRRLSLERNVRAKRYSLHAAR